MSFRTRFLVLTVLLTCFGISPIVSTVAQAAIAQVNSSKQPSQLLDSSLQQLNLSSEQVQKIQKIQNEFQPAIQQKFQEDFQADREVRKLLPSDAPSNQIRELYQRRLAGLQQLYRLDLNYQLAIREVLTAEQRQQRVKQAREFIERSPQPANPAISDSNNSAENVAERFATDLSKQLNLNPEQTQKIRSIAEQYRVQMLAFNPSLQQVSQKLRSQIEGDATSVEIRQTYDQMRQLMQQVNEKAFDRTLAIRDVLNVEQRRRWTFF